ncbi:MAG: hypothetical protein CM1200mP12_09280 [Gammaproteobacteria bacterium]|nr:MAG: hypothetical protein CM1200mP12_09280 [Gammaproteobacteria bacterium]
MSLVANTEGLGGRITARTTRWLYVAYGNCWKETTRNTITGGLIA